MSDLPVPLYETHECDWKQLVLSMVSTQRSSWFLRHAYVSYLATAGSDIPLEA